MSSRIGLQTFTIRRHLRSPGAIDGAFAEVAALGIHAVELAYVKLKPAYIDALEAAGERHGIDFCSSQITFAILDKERDWVVRFHEQLQCPRTAVSVLPFPASRGNRDKLLNFADKLEALGAWYRGRGIQLCFHHHDFEFRRYGDDLGLDLLLGSTSPEHVALELDTYWAHRGGRSPQDMINDLNGRVQVVHLRDYRIRPRLFELLPTDTELGAGNLDLKRIIQTCQATNVPLLAIEQSTSTPYASVERSVSHLHSLGFSHLLRRPVPATQGDTA